MTEILGGRRYYDEFSNWYERERHGGYHQLIDALTVDLAAPFCRGRHILEAGCGTGLLLKELARVAKRVVGLDLSPGMAQKAQQRGLPVVLGSITDLPFATGSFDVALSFKVLAHLEEIDRALAELTRVVRPGGHLILEFYNAQSLRYLAKQLGGPQKISAQHHEGQIFTRWDTPLEVVGRLPRELRLISWHGIRVLTPAAFFHKIPLLGKALGRAEHALRDSPLARFGGFLVVVAQKRGA